VPMEDHAVRTVRRQDREVDEREARAILEKGQYGVLSTVDASGVPYGVPLSYVYRDGEIYIHSAIEGRKVDNLTLTPTAQFSFCVVGATEVQPEMFSTRYESAIASGEVRELVDQAKINSLGWLIAKYSPGFETQGAEYIASRHELTRVFALRIQHLSAKRR